MMYEEDPETNAMADLAVKGEMDFSQLGDPTKLPSILQSLYRQQMGALSQQEASAKQRFEAGEARIKERNQGPTQSEQLFMLSKALLAPRDYRGFAGTVGKISGAFSDISEAERKAREQRDVQLAALQDQYMETTGGYGVKRAQTAADLVKTAAPLLKPKPRRTALSTLTDRVVDLDTAEYVDEQNLPVLTPEQALVASQDPNKKGMRFKTTDGRVREIK